MAANTQKLDQLANSVPSLPGVIHEVKKVLGDFNNPLGTIEQTVNKDPAFAARVLKLANSAYYGFSFKVSTISQALMFLGLSELRSLLIGTSMVKVFKGMKSNFVNMELFWKHSVACGICARQLAIRMREVNAEEFFIAGLMHDLGRLIMFCAMPQKAEEAYEIARTKRISITEAENTAISFNHADLSAHVLKEWKLPPILYEVVKAHHNPALAEGFNRQAIIIHLADTIVDAMDMGNSGEGIIAPASNVNFDLFQGNEATLPAVMDEVDSMTADLVKIFLTEA